ncbi:hypothetical protein ACP70R_016857 [Stipagrostis hirtigluma subsp. patula]
MLLLTVGFRSHHTGWDRAIGPGSGPGPTSPSISIYNLLGSAAASLALVSCRRRRGRAASGGPPEEKTLLFLGDLRPTLRNQT